MRKTLLLTIGVLATVLFGANAQQRGTVQNYNLSNGPLTNLSTPVSGGIISSAPANSPQFMGGGCVSDTLLFEDFQSQTIAFGWSNADLDGLVDANGRPAEYYVTQDLQTTLPGDTNYVAASSSWFTPPGVANNVLATPPVTICDASVNLIWKSAPFEGPTFMDGYTVSVLNTTTFVETVVAEFAEGDAVGNVGAGIAHTNFNGLNGVLQEWTVSLAPFVGQTIAIFFTHDSDDDNLIMLDDIFVGIPANGDVSTSEAYRGSEYTFVPESQNQPITPSALMSNNGSVDANNPTMTFDAWLLGSSVYNNAVLQGPLAGNSQSTFTASTPGNLLTIGDYLITASASADELDPDLSNNVDTALITITDNVYGRDDNVINGVLSINNTEAGFLGNQFEIFSATNAVSISAFLNAAQLGDTVSLNIYNMAGGVPTTLAGTSGTHIIGPADTGGVFLTLPMLGGPVPLSPGEYVVGVEESVAGEMTLGYSTDNYVPGTTWVFAFGVWDNSENYGFFPAYVVRLNLCDAPTAGWSSTDNNLSVDFSSTSTGDAWLSHQWDFGDGTTDTTANPVHTYGAPGTYTVCLIVSNSCGADTLCQTVIVTCPAPVADWSVTSIFELNVALENNSTGSNLAHFWDFGDGNTATTTDALHVYSAAGTYTVCLTVSNVCGADSSCGTVTVSSIVLPPNDSCIDAITINCGDVLSGNTTNATDDVGPDFCAEFGESGPGVWYTTVGDGSSMTFSTCSPNTDFDTEITVMSGDCNNLVCVGSNDDGNCPTGALLSDFTFSSQVGVTYYIYVGSYFSGAAGGNFDLTMTCTPPPPGDDVCDPIALSMGANGPYDNTAAGTQPGEPYPGIGSGLNSCESQDGWCDFENGLDNTMWFTFVAPPSGNMTIHTDNSSFDTQIAVYSGDSCQNLLTGGETLIAANDDNPDYVVTQFSSILNLCGLTPGETYYLQVDGYNGASGNLQIDLVANPLTAAYISSATGLTASFTDASAPSALITSYLWDFGDGNTSTDMNPSHTYAANGTYLICLTVTDTTGCAATICDTLTVTDIPTSIFDAVNRGMVVYPNPSNGRFTVSFTGAEAEVLMEVTDIAGRLIYSEAETLTNGFSKEIELDAANGTYLLQIKITEGVVSRRLQIH